MADSAATERESVLARWRTKSRTLNSTKRRRLRRKVVAIYLADLRIALVGNADALATVDRIEELLGGHRG